MDSGLRDGGRFGTLRVMWDDYAGLPPFRRKDAPDHGLTDADVRRLLDHGVLIRLGYGLIAGYRREELATEAPAKLALRVQSMQRRYPIGVAGYRTAAVLHRLWIIGWSGPVHLVRVRGRQREKHDVQVETADLPPEHRCVVEGVVATSLTRTTVDLAQRLDSSEALALVDSALRQGATIEDLLAMCDQTEIEATHRVREVIGLGDALAESPLESMSRWELHRAGVPMPELQTTIGDELGPFAAADFYWKDAGVIGEADGMLKYDEDPEALKLERRRQARLERLGFIVVRWTWDELMTNPFEVMARIRDALDRGLAKRRGIA